ncbi:hypothetical protein PYJP_11420 [Pyrofollis japonicus]|uniref:branched-chain amino acid ABC transporter permease n=1 Tax=Pyrofollis japonicus TaxID=3060460 RepID=UPI00295B3A38|nr:branched-chain amino acid ABC transporter permease [Pyrofollis japonicus]BEP17790.1 hypothetical protein PYJP_11420 [Pyrofollis japonicus]
MVNAVALAEQVFSFIGVYAIVTLALNIKAGHTGIPDFGHAMFFGIGGIVVGNLAAHLAAALAAGSVPGVSVSGVLANNTATLNALNTQYFPSHPGVAIGLILFAIVVALVLGGIVGWLASLPALRLRGEYLAILLLATAEAVRIFVTYTKQIMGSTPTVGLSTPDLFAWAGDSGAAATVFTVLMAIIVFIVFERIHNSPAGRLFRAVRDDEDAAKALGRDVVVVRRDAMIIGSAVAALGGVVYALNPFLGGGAVAAASIFNRVFWTFWPWALMILGGMASNRGVVAATILVGVLLVWPIRVYKVQLAEALGASALGLDPNSFANALEYLLLGLLIILALALKPEGIIPEPPSKTLDFKQFAKRVLGKDSEAQ